MKLKTLLKKSLKSKRILLVFITLIISLNLLGMNIKPNGLLIEKAIQPTSQIKGNILTQINDQPINTIQDYNNFLNQVKQGDIIKLTILENQDFFGNGQKKQLPPYLAFVDEETNKTTLGLTLSAVQSSKLKFGLELVGGTKLILKPERALTDVEFENLLAILRQRLDLFGVSGATVTSIQDLQGNIFIQTELAGVGSDQARQLLSKEGKFEAKIGNDTVFYGTDIVDVCISGQGCVYSIQQRFDQQGNEFYNFEFQVGISQESAQRFADITRNKTDDCSGAQCYLVDKLSFYLDDKIIEGADLNIPSNIKGQAITTPVITGSRTNQEEAINEVRFLQSILQSRKLPVSLEIESSQTVSPTQGSEFLKNIFKIFLLSILFVDLIIAIRYKKPLLILITVFISLSEIIITLGLAALMKWTMDIASIAGILASVGTGIDDQIVIIDETESEHNKEISVKRRIKKAFFIVFAAYFVGMASMTPLLFAGAGLLKGFAVTSMIGITVGVFITRPAFAKLIEIIK